VNLDKETLKVAVVGLGKMGLLHSCILNVIPNVQIVALCEKSGLIRRFFKKIFDQTIIVDDIAKLADLDINTVYITTPIPSHFPIAKTIYQEKIAQNLFVEKTLASNYEEAKQLCAFAERLGGVNMVGYMRRFAVTFKKAKELLNEEAVGNINSFRAYAFSSDFYERRKDLKAPGARGGVLNDLGCHIIDLALWFFSDLQVDSVKLESFFGNNSEHSAHVNIQSLNGISGTFDISWCAANYRMPEVGITINGSEGTIEANDDTVKLKLNSGKTSTWYRHDLDDNVFYWLGGPEYFREDESFIKSILESNQAEPNFRTASKVDQIIDHIKNYSKEAEGNKI
jgi:predicted dehydrogenase